MQNNVEIFNLTEWVNVSVQMLVSGGEVCDLAFISGIKKLRQRSAE